MAIYVTLFILIVISGLFYNRKGISYKATKNLFITVVLLFLLIQCFRSVNVGEDNATYIEWFREYCSYDKIVSLFHPWRDIDLGYSILNIILSRISSNERILIVAVSFIIVLTHVSFIRRNSKNFLLSISLYLGCNFFLTSMVSWRQFISMGIVFWGVPLLLNKKYIRAMLIFVLGFLFHDTSICFSLALIGIYLFSKKRHLPIVILMIGIIFIPFSEILINLCVKFFPSLSLYFDGNISAGGPQIGKLRMIYIIVEFFLVFLAYRKNKSNNPRIIILTSLVAIAAVVGIFSFKIPYAFRFSYFFDFFLLLLIPEFVSNDSRGQMMRAFIISMCFILFLYYLSYNPGQTVPYEFFLN